MALCSDFKSKERLIKIKFIYDHDLHIHSGLSLCSNDPLQNPQNILEYAKQRALKTICITDHFWDDNVTGSTKWYAQQNFSHISESKPLPSYEGLRFLFGCECELDKFLSLSVSQKTFDLFDFVVIPTTHFHMKDFALTSEQYATPESKARAWADRLAAVLAMPLPFHKIGIAHLTCTLIGDNRENYLETLRLLDKDKMVALFENAASLGVGIELNSSDMRFRENEAETVLRPYRIARTCGCKFYLGSDAHHPNALFAAKEPFEKAIDMLNLEENDKFLI